MRKNYDTVVHVSPPLRGRGLIKMFNVSGYIKQFGRKLNKFDLLMKSCSVIINRIVIEFTALKAISSTHATIQRDRRGLLKRLLRESSPRLLRVACLRPN